MFELFQIYLVKDPMPGMEIKIPKDGDTVDLLYKYDKAMEILEIKNNE